MGGLSALLGGALLLAAQVRADSGLDACVNAPQQPECSSFLYSDSQILEDIDLNCFQMPWMVGCSVWSACQAGEMGDPESNQYCSPMRVLATICNDDGMSSMRGCANYASLCFTPGSVVQQCKTSRAIPGMPHTAATQVAIAENCADHNMQGCEECTGKNNLCPDTLLSLRNVCNAHRMEMCADYYDFCTTNGAGMDHFCSLSGAAYDPPMRMYFHTGITDIILFRRWVPTSNGAYAGAIIAVMLAGVFASALRAWRSAWDAKDRITASLALRTYPTQVSAQNIFHLPREQIPAHLFKSVLQFTVIVLDYALMLAAMTFNVGIFFAVCAGLALGWLLIGHVPTRYAQKLQAAASMGVAKCACVDGADSASEHCAIHGKKQVSEVPAEFAVARTESKPERQSNCCGSERSSSQQTTTICCSERPFIDFEAAHPEPAMVPHCCQ